MRRETAEVDALKLDESSRRLLAAMTDHPIRGRTNFLMEKLSDGTWSLVVKIPSPTGDRRRTISLWLDEKRVPSLEFGAWHSHADLWDPDPDVGLRRMLDYLERITDGEIVLAELPTVGDGMPYRVIDMTDREEILDELTSPDVPPEMKLLSWSGAEDALLSDLREQPA
ncbi:MAG TPA: hypothetical protein VH374_03940 [Polyangia bacterium]|jgi:hypothetical protein|nr:hypothetical protein [Polyangia bacterium]